MKDAVILYVEDDISLSFVTQDNLEMAGFRVLHCTSGIEGFRIFEHHTVNLCLIDVMLPEMDGFCLARKIRQINASVPIIFLSAKSLKEDRITGLTLGADDYITKPFSIEELILKVNIFLRRSHPSVLTPLPAPTVGKYLFDRQQQTLTYEEHQQSLTARETQLLDFLLERKGEICKREEILLTIWQEDDYFMGRSLDVFISRLRKYLKKDPNIVIENIHGVGFRLAIR